jgi:hypothetical protein
MVTLQIFSHGPETPADSAFIIVKGKAKDYVRKSIEQIEQETKYRFEHKKGTEEDTEMTTHHDTEDDPLSSPAKSLKSMKSQIIKSKLMSGGAGGNQEGEKNSANSPIRSLKTMKSLAKSRLLNVSPSPQRDQTDSEDDLSSPGKSIKSPVKSPIAKKLQKAKNMAMTLIPSYFSDPNKNANQIFEDKKYRKILLKKSPVKLKGHPELFKDIDPEVNEVLFDKFLKKKMTYFAGPILKVKYAMTLLAGDSIGLEGLVNQFAMRGRVLVADTECKVIRIAYRPFNEALDIEKKILGLKHSIFCRVFGFLDRETEMLKFMHTWSEHKARQEEVLYNELDSSDKLYLIGEGNFAVKIVVFFLIRSSAKPEKSILIL